MSSAPNQDNEVTVTITDPVKIMNFAWEMIRSAKDEVLILFATGKSFARQDRAGVGQFLKELTAKTTGLKVKILAPKNKRVEELRSELKQSNIDVKYIQEFSQTKITMGIVDRKKSIVVELKNDETMDALEAIGQSTYSTRSMTVLSYVSIFESYWALSELYEESENELAYTKDYLKKVMNELEQQKK